MNFLISGTSSGLGKHLRACLGGAVWKRESAPRSVTADVIVHCGWPARPPQTQDGLADYVENTLSAARELMGVAHRKFVFISSTDVYPPPAKFPCLEDVPVDLGRLHRLNGIAKLMLESLVRARCPNCLILRVTGLLGPTMRPNGLWRILHETPCQLTLTAASRFNYVLHADVSAFLSYAVQHDLQGIYNVASVGNVSLGEIARLHGKQVAWGEFHYEAAEAANDKISALFPAFRKTSLEVVQEFVSSLPNTPHL
jgi:nucleoside-diphosphate-sugar epimerase